MTDNHCYSPSEFANNDPPPTHVVRYDWMGWFPVTARDHRHAAREWSFDETGADGDEIEVEVMKADGTDHRIVKLTARVKWVCARPK